jgi:hypothetical protein
MISNELGLQLHDRDTLGQPLTEEEQEQLAAWYAEQDAAETALLEAHALPLPSLVTLQLQVNQANDQLSLGVQRLQQMMQDNNALREEISGLKQQLSTPRSA